MSSSAINQVISWINFGCSIVGTVGNVLTCVVCLSSRLRKTPTFIFMTFMVCADTVPVVIVILNRFAKPLFGINRLESTLQGCKIETMLLYMSTQSSAFLLVYENLSCS